VLSICSEGERITSAATGQPDLADRATSDTETAFLGGVLDGGRDGPSFDRQQVLRPTQLASTSKRKQSFTSAQHRGWVDYFRFRAPCRLIQTFLVD